MAQYHFLNFIELPSLLPVYYGKGKAKVLPRTGHEGPEWEQMYSSTLPSTSALDGVGWSAPRLGRFTPGKTRYPLYRRLGGPQGRSGRVWKMSPPPGFDPRTVQAVASRYTDWAIPPPRGVEGSCTYVEQALADSR